MRHFTLQYAAFYKIIAGILMLSYGHLRVLNISFDKNSAHFPSDNLPLFAAISMALCQPQASVTDNAGSPSALPVSGCTQS